MGERRGRRSLTSVKLTRARGRLRSRSRGYSPIEFPRRQLECDDASLLYSPLDVRDCFDRNGAGGAEISAAARHA